MCEISKSSNRLLISVKLIMFPACYTVDVTDFSGVLMRCEFV